MYESRIIFEKAADSKHICSGDVSECERLQDEGIGKFVRKIFGRKFWKNELPKTLDELAEIMCSLGIAKDIYEYLLEKPFDSERHSYLIEINVQPNFGKLIFDKAALDDFRQRCR